MKKLKHSSNLKLMKTKKIIKILNKLVSLILKIANKLTNKIILPKIKMIRTIRKDNHQLLYQRRLNWHLSRVLRLLLINF
jgi:hypothetical protein